MARALGALALLAVGATGCNSFLEGGELTTDPNRPTAATNRQLFVGAQTNIWSILTSDPARITGMWMQQFEGGQSQYVGLYQYGVAEQTTNGFHQAIYAGGGLKDVRALEDSARAQGDSLMLGVANVMEAMLMGTGADLFGDLVYTEALKGTPNPPLTPQLEIYDSLQVKLDEAITLLGAFKGTTTNLGPGSADLNYGDRPVRDQANAWRRLAYTLKARNYLHTAEVRQGAYAQARTAAQNGIQDPADDYKAVFSGNAGETNLWFQFTLEQRFGYLLPNATFVDLLESRNDPRRETYFDADAEFLAGEGEGDANRIDPGYDQRLVTSQENKLIIAEAAYRAGDQGTALTQLQSARADAADVEDVTLPALGSTAGTALLREILTEKYIALFQTLEPWNDYKRTCFPNLTPVVSGLKIPARLLYDTPERQTNTSIPGAEGQPARNANDPRNTTDPFGNACLGQ